MQCFHALSRYGSIFYFSAQVMVGTVRLAIAVFLPTSRTRFADERGVSPLRLQMG